VLAGLAAPGPGNLLPYVIQRTDESKRSLYFFQVDEWLSFTNESGRMEEKSSRQDRRMPDEAVPALREQREWLRVTLASIGDAVITTDTEGRVTFLNSVAESLTGWTLEEAACQPIDGVSASSAKGAAARLPRPDQRHPQRVVI
jgi:PAS domain-containing protein